MANRRVEMYEYRQIIYRLQQGQRIRAISRDGLAGRDKIREIEKVAKTQGWLNQNTVLPDEKTLYNFFAKKLQINQKLKVAAYSDTIAKWVQEGIQAKVIHQHLQNNFGFEGAYNCVQRFVKKIKRQNIQLTVPLHFQPGEAAQVDFGQGPKLIDDRTGCVEKTWFFVFTLCWSRHQYAELVTHQDVETWLNCHQNAFNWFNGVVKKIIIDNAKCAITKACYYEPQIQRSYEAFAQEYGFIISACPPREPKKKGRVESGVKYVKHNFLPLRQLKSLQNANLQLREWILSTAGNRTHGSTFEKPLNRFTEIEKNQLKPLPLIAPEVAVWQKVTSYKNCHVYYLKNYYSVPYTEYGKELWLKASASTITIYYEGNIIGKHARLFKIGEYSTIIEHLSPNAKTFLTQDNNWCLQEALRIGENTYFIVNKFLKDETKDLLRSAQGIIKLGKKYTEARLELACKRAKHFNAISYQNIKTILTNGLDYQSISENESFDKLNSVYQGKGLFQRQSVVRVH